MAGVRRDVEREDVPVGWNRRVITEAGEAENLSASRGDESARRRVFDEVAQPTGDVGVMQRVNDRVVHDAAIGVTPRIDEDSR